MILENVWKPVKTFMSLKFFSWFSKIVHYFTKMKVIVYLSDAAKCGHRHWRLWFLFLTLQRTGRFAMNVIEVTLILKIGSPQINYMLLYSVVVRACVSEQRNGKLACECSVCSIPLLFAVHASGHAIRKVPIFFKKKIILKYNV